MHELFSDRSSAEYDMLLYTVVLSAFMHQNILILVYESLAPAWNFRPNQS